MLVEEFLIVLANMIVINNYRCCDGGVDLFVKLTLQFLVEFLESCQTNTNYVVAAQGPIAQHECINIVVM